MPAECVLVFVAIPAILCIPSCLIGSFLCSPFRRSLSIRFLVSFVRPLLDFLSSFVLYRRPTRTILHHELHNAPVSYKTQVKSRFGIPNNLRHLRLLAFTSPP